MIEYIKLGMGFYLGKLLLGILLPFLIVGALILVFFIVAYVAGAYYWIKEKIIKVNNDIRRS